MKPSKITVVKKFPHGNAFQFIVSLTDIPQNYLDETKEMLTDGENVNLDNFFVRVVLDKNGWEILDNTVYYMDSKGYYLMIGDRQISEDSKLAKDIFKFCINSIVDISTL